MADLKFLNLPERIAGLGELAYNLWWSWHPAAWKLFQGLDRLVWTETDHNPVMLLRILPQSTLKRAASDPVYLRRYDAVLAEFRRKVQSQVCWFTENIIPTACLPIAYFSLDTGCIDPCHSMPEDWVSWPEITSRSAVTWGFPW